MPIIDRALLEKYIHGECSPEEEELVLHWLDESEKDDYPGVHSEKEYNKKIDKGWRQLTRHIQELKIFSRRQSFHKKLIWTIAAALALLIGSSFFLFLTGKIGASECKVKYGTSYGELKQITLADGTEVTMNSESELKVEKGFNQRNRVVYLKGEAFFNIKRKSNLPFVVKTNVLSITALGTSFDVFAFADEPEADVSLKTGKVLVKAIASKKEDDVILSPGEGVTYQKNTALLTTEKFNADVQMAWQNRIIAFQNAGMEQVVHQLERYFGVTINTQFLPPRRWELTGEYKDPSLTNILESLSFSYGIKYKIEGREVTLYK